MNKISAVFLVLIFAAVGFTGFAVASDAETPDLVPPLSVPITDVSDFILKYDTMFLDTYKKGF